MAGHEFIKFLSDKQRGFLKYILHIGIDKIIPTSMPNDAFEPYMLDLTLSNWTDTELYDQGEFWLDNNMDIFNWITKIINKDSYDYDAWDVAKLNSLGIYYTRYLKETMKKND
jgi:hypothetical protein